MTGPLVTAAELAAELTAAEPPLLLDVRWALGSDSGRAEYLAGHLPDAVWVDLDRDLAAAPGAGGRHPLPTPAAFQAAARRLGVSDGRAVIAYDGGNQLGAARLWWLLTDGGKTDVRVLTGGFAAWVAAGGPVEAGDVPAEPGDVTLTAGSRPVVDLAGIRSHLQTGGVLWDVRAPERYRGETETVDPVAGHIPGAQNLPVGGFTGPEGFAAVETLRTVLREVRPGDVMSCGSGVTAAAGILAAEAAGIPGVALYPGSWSQWVSDSRRPVATGAEPGSLPRS